PWLAPIASTRRKTRFLNRNCATSLLDSVSRVSAASANVVFFAAAWYKALEALSILFTIRSFPELVPFDRGLWRSTPVTSISPTCPDCLAVPVIPGSLRSRESPRSVTDSYMVCLLPGAKMRRAESRPVAKGLGRGTGWRRPTLLEPLTLPRQIKVWVACPRLRGHVR